MGRTRTPCSVATRGGWLMRFSFGILFLLAIQGVRCEHEPTESECRPYIEKALKDHHVDDADLSLDATSIEQEENPPIDESNEEQTGENASTESASADDGGSAQTDADTTTEDAGESLETAEGEDENKTEEDTAGDSQEGATEGGESIEGSQEGEGGSQEADAASQEGSQETDAAEGGEAASQEAEGDTTQEGDTTESVSQEAVEQAEAETANQETETGSSEGENAEAGSQEGEATEAPASSESETAEASSQEGEPTEAGSQERDTAEARSLEGDTAEAGSQEGDTAEAASQEGDTAEAATSSESETVDAGSQEGEPTEAGSQEADTTESGSQEGDTAETGSQEGDTAEAGSQEAAQEEGASGEADGDTAESVDEGEVETVEDTTAETTEEGQAAETEESTKEESAEAAASTGETTEASTEEAQADAPAEEVIQETTEETAETGGSQEEAEEVPEEELNKETLIPTNLRSRDHITQILKLDEESIATESLLAKTTESTLKTLKNLYDNAIKPLEILYKYRDLSNRHFGDPEIFSKPLVLLMGPWSGGKSSTINYLLDLEFTDLQLRTGAEPSPAYFNILTYGEETEILDGTQLAADWTFSGLQKFGQGMLDRLRGVRLPNRLLEKVNIVEIPGILEIRKQVQRLFPFNDACQWFIDRADIIFLVYDPAKLDVGPETEAILDQLKGREYQTRIILNKADQVKPEELMRVQGTLIWNISPLMSSQEPPVMYTTSLWSLPYESTAPARLLMAQERALLRDLRDAIERRVENKIASARRFAVRVRNHAKMVDCYLTTYYNHKTFFGNRKKISDDIIENPTKYHIYEGLSTLTNISRYDLPDPEMYRDFFRINPLYEFTKLSDTCTYFRGCPINKLDIAIAYDLPELVGKYKKAYHEAKSALDGKTNS